MTGQNEPFDPHLDDHSDDLSQPPEYDGPDWDPGEALPTAQCVARSEENAPDHKIQED